VSGLLAVISAARVLVLFLESRALVNDERQQDRELLELCRTGAARGSVKMRTACLQAQADQASPLILKAIVRAVSTAWSEFLVAVSTPFGAFAVLLFLVSSLVLPVLPWARALATVIGADDHRHLLDDDDDVESSHVIVLTGGGANTGYTTARNRLFSRKSSFSRDSPKIEMLNHL